MKMESESEQNQDEQASSPFIKHAGNQTKRFGEQTWTLLSSHIRSTVSITPAEKSSHQPPPPSKSHTKAITFLKGLPAILAFVFILARFWDFTDVHFTLFHSTIALDGLLTLISVSGLIGYLTNWLAITMLFQPKYKRPILGQGLIPAQKNRIAYRLAQAVSTDLINPEIIKQKLIAADLIGIYRRKFIGLVHQIIQNPTFRQELKEVISQYVKSLVEDPEIRAGLAKDLIEKFERSLDEKSIEKIALKTYMMMRGDHAQHLISNAIGNLPQNLDHLLDKLDTSLDKIPDFIDSKSEQIEEWVSRTLFSVLQQFDVHQLVEENIQRFDEDRISNLIRGTTNEQFQYIQYLGAFLGMFGGLIIWQPIWATLTIGLIIGLVMGLDELLYRLKSKKN
jgi:uncharacterized membrane protein YheB (UPF0754 family)